MMTDFFKSAFGGMFGQAGGTQGTSNSNITTQASSYNNEFVGQSISIGSHKLRITKLIAEGGYAMVYLAVDLSSGEEYALKRIFSADDTSNKAIRDEIGYLKRVANHPNLIQFISAACEELENSRSKEFLILTELCKDSIIDHLRAGLALPSGRAFNPEQVLQIFYQICSAVQFLHAQEPCIIHRDLKLENFLVSKGNQIKLCDFGSATSEIYQPDNSWSVNKRNLIEEEIAKQTTPMYRAPEMLDLYNNYRIDSQADIWALGCVLFVLCFSKHPFEDAAKLRIINGKYQIPSSDKEFTDFYDLIRQMLQINPSDRPNINEVIFALENIAQTKSVVHHPQQPLNFLKNTESLSSAAVDQGFVGSSSTINDNYNVRNRATTPVAPSVNGYQNQKAGAGWYGNAASIFGNKGTSFMSSIKAASNKVIESVQAINKNDLDLTYITSRLIVMSCPTEGIESAAFGNNIDLIKEALESRHGRFYRIYNLANKTFKKEKFSQVIDLGSQLSNTRAPPNSLMLKLCANVLKFLKENQNNVCVINCNDGRVISGIAVCILFMYCDLIKSIDACLNMFSAKRGLLNLTPVQYNYLKDVQRLLASTRHEIRDGFNLSANECLMTSIVIMGVPLFNRLRNGCTPYVEIYNKDKKIYTNLTEYAQMRKYTARDGQIMIPINCHKFYGDMTVFIFHAKSLLGTEKTTSSKICQLQFHTAFISQQLIDTHQIIFKKDDLDGLDSGDKYPSSFSVVLNMDLKSNVSPMSTDEPWTNPEQFESLVPKVPQSILFSDPNEMERLVHIFDSSAKAYSDENSSNFTSFVETNTRLVAKKAQDSENNQDTFTCYLTTTTKNYDDNSSAKSSRSTSPMPEMQGYAPASFDKQASTGNALLLDFEGDDKNSYDSNNVAPHSKNEEANLKNDFELLLDLEETNQNFFPSNNTKPTNDKLNDLDDLFGGINQPNTVPTVSQSTTFDPFESLMQPSQASKNSSFGNLNLFDTIRPSNASINNSGSINKMASQTPSVSKPMDPFADLTAFGSQASKSSSQNKLNSSNNITTPNPPNTTPKFDPFAQNTNNKSNYFIPTTTTASNPNLSRQNLPPPQQQAPKSQAKPNVNFMSSAATSASGASSAFDDFLPSSFAQNQSKGNRTLKDLQREVNSKEVDPNKLKVQEWTDGKKANIRALLCSLHKVLWEGEERWEVVGMQQLVSASDVKKVYRKAVLVVHPDKLSDHPQIELARLIFLELNDAWAQFNNEGQKNLF